MTRKLYVEYVLNGKFHKQGPFESADWAFGLFELLIQIKDVRGLCIVEEAPQRPKRFVQPATVPKEQP